MLVPDRTIWRCPRCRGSLADEGGKWRCTACERRYPLTAGIPDLRVDGASWIDFDDDRCRANELADTVPADDVEASVDFVFRRRQQWEERLVSRRVRQVLEQQERLRSQLDGWLSPLVAQPTVLDVGCGPGALLAVLASTGGSGIGVDVSLEWLVVAQRMIKAAGGEPLLACGMAEALPLADRSVGAVAVLDVIEHVGDPQALVSEVSRVIAPGGVVVLATPNRFSVAAEPHVGVWGVGWLPARLQNRYVRWRSGGPYGFVHLLSRRSLAKLFDRHSEIVIRISPGPVPADELRTFSARRTALAKVYNAIVVRPLPARLISPISPFFQLVGRRG